MTHKFNQKVNPIGVRIGIVFIVLGLLTIVFRQEDKFPWLAFNLPLGILHLYYTGNIFKKACIIIDDQRIELYNPFGYRYKNIDRTDFLKANLTYDELHIYLKSGKSTRIANPYYSLEDLKQINFILSERQEDFDFQEPSNN